MSKGFNNSLWKPPRKRYISKCRTCKETLWITYTDNGYKPLNEDGEPHTCKYKKGV